MQLIELSKKKYYEKQTNPIVFNPNKWHSYSYDQTDPRIKE